MTCVYGGRKLMWANAYVVVWQGGWTFLCVYVCWYVHIRTNECNVLMYTGHAILPNELIDVLTYRWMCILLLLLLLLLLYDELERMWEEAVVVYLTVLFWTCLVDWRVYVFMHVHMWITAEWRSILPRDWLGTAHFPAWTLLRYPSPHWSEWGWGPSSRLVQDIGVGRVKLNTLLIPMGKTIMLEALPSLTSYDGHDAYWRKPSNSKNTVKRLPSFLLLKPMTLIYQK
jgi:hypothetical protein